LFGRGREDDDFLFEMGGEMEGDGSREVDDGRKWKKKLEPVVEYMYELFGFYF